MLVKEIMTKEFVKINSNDSIFDASVLVRDKKVSCLIVMDNDFCVGVVSTHDIIGYGICARKDPEKIKVSEIMSSDVKTVYPLDKIEKAVDVMETHNVRGLPVVVKDEIVGVITVTDIARAIRDLSKRFMGYGLNLGID